MTEDGVKKVVAGIIIGGHVFVFFVGLIMGIFGPLTGLDALQTVLIAVPVLAATGIAAVKFALTIQPIGGIKKSRQVPALYWLVATGIPSALILSILIIFFAAALQVNGFGPEQMKVALGLVEAMFGAYLGYVADRMFGK